MNRVSCIALSGLLGLALAGCGSSKPDGPEPPSDVVALEQSPTPRAADLTPGDIADLVGRAVSPAGGLDFVEDGQTVVLKPNLPKTTARRWRAPP